MDRNKEHPVWDVYDLRRTARLNVKYYGFKLNRLRKINFWMEFLLALTASSAVVAFNFWKSHVGSVAWQVLSVLSALLAVAKPLLKYTEKIRGLEEVLTGFRILDHDLKVLGVSIKQKQKYDNELKERFLSAFERMKTLISKEVYEDREDKALIRKLQGEVNKELPPEDFFIPNSI